MTEVELKAALTEAQAQALPGRLAALGFLPVETLGETDLYFNAAQRDFHKTDEALRLRRCRNLSTGADEALLTYKGPKRDPRSNTRTEYETAVADADMVRSILKALGYEPQYIVDKTRSHFMRGTVTVCLDTVTNLGSFVELESILEDDAGYDGAVDSLLALLDQLDVSREALSRKSYLELLIAADTVKKSS